MFSINSGPTVFAIQLCIPSKGSFVAAYNAIPPKAIKVNSFFHPVRLVIFLKNPSIFLTIESNFIFLSTPYNFCSCFCTKRCKGYKKSFNKSLPQQHLSSL